MAASPEQGLATFGIVLTGRLQLKNVRRAAPRGSARRDGLPPPPPRPRARRARARAHARPSVSASVSACGAAHRGVRLRIGECVVIAPQELMSTLSGGKEVWQERYAVLTRKGIHFYVRQPDGTDSYNRDIFGQHDGSIGLSNIARVDEVRGRSSDSEEKESLLRCTLVTKGGSKNYHFKAETTELLERWLGALQSAIGSRDHTVPRVPSVRSQRDMAGGRHLMSTRTLGGGAFPRPPTLVDFRKMERTDNLMYVSLLSAKLSLEILLESGLPWGGSHLHSICGVGF